MEQLYLVEIFIDKITIFVPEDENSGANKRLITKIKFGPSVQFIIKESQMAPNTKLKDDIIECDEQGKRKWCRTIRVGQSFLFPSYNDTVLLMLEKFPLEIEIWNDDENEVEIFVGIGTMIWDTEFYHMLKEAVNPYKVYEPLTIKSITKIFAECCCRQVGDIAFILRLSVLGNSIITEYQQLMDDPDYFVFRSNKAPSMFKCQRLEGNDPNFCMVGSIYETTTLEDPDVVNAAKNTVEVCTELQSCGTATQNATPSCQHIEKPKKKKYAIDKIRMGDIIGPCGNTNCPLAHKVRHYIRALDTYKKEAAGKVKGTKDDASSKVCGSCVCKDDTYHREICSESKSQAKSVCTGCGGLATTGDSCEDRVQKLYGTGATPKGSKTQVSYVFNVHHVPDFRESISRKNVPHELNKQKYDNLPPEFQSGTSKSTVRCLCQCNKSQQPIIDTYTTKTENSLSKTYSKFQQDIVNEKQETWQYNNVDVYNVDMKNVKPGTSGYLTCTETPEEKDCRCNPPKPTPPCKTFDCDCITEVGNIDSRKRHKPYCPSYKHKNNCPVTMLSVEVDNNNKEDDEDDTELLPYGLPPIRLGPCPIMGRPCTVPDGFARMYKVAVQPTAPPSYGEAGKVCCSKEYERIKKALKEYMKNDKENDFRCINRFNVDTERRCCDKEQRLLALTGKSCCGSHKKLLEDKFKDPKK